MRRPWVSSYAMPLRLPSVPSETRCVGVSMRWRIASISAVPPAMTRHSSPRSASMCVASDTDTGCRKSKSRTGGLLLLAQGGEYFFGRDRQVDDAHTDGVVH